jgi:glutamyl-tRNA synthetase
MTLLRSRLAPTPSGCLHEGNAFSFVLTWLLTRSEGGFLHLRIDDLDSDRSRPEYIDDIFETLEWLGLDYDSGPRSVEDFVQHWSQYRRIDAYNQALERLREQDCLFVCECSRSTPNAFLENGVYAGLCRRKNLPFSQQQAAWRFRSELSNEAVFTEMGQGKRSFNVAEMMGDVILRRKDGIPAYQIASLVDDVFDNITFIVRGNDLLPSTAVQCALAEKLGFTGFLNGTFLHHLLLRDESAQKLSKSKGARSLRAWREKGTPPHSIYRAVAEYCGIAEQNVKENISTAQELLAEYQALRAV